MRFFRENLVYKILALVCSLALWGYIKLREDPLTLPITLRLEVRGLADNLVASPSVTQVPVYLSGPRIYVSRLDPESLSAWVTMRDRGPGLYRPDVRVDLPEGLRSTVSAAPAMPTVDVRVEPKERKTVGVTVNWQNALPPGSEYDQVETDPPVVDVAGARSVVALVHHVLARPVAGPPQVKETVPILAVDANNQPIAEASVTPTQVEVRATLKRTQAQRQVFVGLDIKGTPGSGFVIKEFWTEPQSVLIIGPSSVINEISTVRTKPLDIAGAKNSIIRQMALEVPTGVTAFPPRVRAHVQIVRD